MPARGGRYAGAPAAKSPFAPRQPKRDLLLPPDDALFSGSVIAPVGYLVTAARRHRPAASALLDKSRNLPA